MSYSISNVLAETGLPNIMRWVPFEVQEEDIRNRIKNKMIRPTTIPQTKEELLGYLKEQIRFLIDSSSSYDSGFQGEAKRLATVIRVLLHDTPRSTSLLTQLDKKTITFYDTAIDYDPNNLAPHIGLVMFRISTQSGAEYVAPLDNLSPSRIKKGKVSFDEWWNKIVFKDNQNNFFTRGDLVLTVANKEGGTHIDPKLKKAYANLSRFNSLGWKSSIRKGGVEIEADLNNPVSPSIRQIAHEVIKTLKDEFPDLF